MKGYYNNIDEVFCLLNENKINYLILRNFEELENENMFVQGHPDIDMLCEDSLSVVRLLGAFSSRKVTTKHYGDGTHYYIFIKNRYVSLDLRHIGDDYYCTKWERDLLDSKEFYQNFYIPNHVQLFYTLIYHAIFQKKSFSKEYELRLNQMARQLNLVDNLCDKAKFVFLLEEYMKKQSYRYVYPKDVCVPLMKQWSNGKLVDFSLSTFVPHYLFQSKVALIELLVKIKHALKK